MNEMNRIIKAICLPVIGLLMVLAGFVYDLLFAGIPYQDPTPELQARYDLHSSVAGLLYKTGGLVLLLALLAIPIILQQTRKDKCQQAPGGDREDAPPQE